MSELHACSLLHTPPSKVVKWFSVHNICAMRCFRLEVPTHSPFSEKVCNKTPIFGITLDKPLFVLYALVHAFNFAGCMQLTYTTKWVNPIYLLICTYLPVRRLQCMPTSKCTSNVRTDTSTQSQCCTGFQPRPPPSLICSATPPPMFSQYVPVPTEPSGCPVGKTLIRIWVMQTCSLLQYKP